MNRIVSSFLLLLVYCQPSLAQNKIAFPLKVSGNNHYLFDQRNNPVFLNGDSPWMLGFKVRFDEVKEYLKDRNQKGFNAVIMQVTPGTDFGTTQYDYGDLPNIYGDHVFINQDISKPNELYFKHLDSILFVCNQMNFVVLLAPLYQGCCEDGWKEILDRDPESIEKAYNYGKWIANRYKNLPNIIWVSGGDHKVTPQALACAEGIEKMDTIHLQTFHSGAGSTSYDEVPHAKWLKFNMIYTYHAAWIADRLGQLQVYAPFFRAWQKRINMPMIMSESGYEYERDETTQILRRQAYWSVLSGASGHFYGHRDIWPFNKNWRAGLNSPGAQSIEIFGKFVKSIPWYDMEPDWPATLFVSGRGAFNNSSAPGGEEYATAAFSKEHGVAAIYLPTSRTVGVNMVRFSGTVNAKWLDPSTGVYSKERKVFPNKGIHHFTPPKQYNSQGFDDWVLVLETNNL